MILNFIDPYYFYLRYLNSTKKKKKSVKPLIKGRKIIPERQFGFRNFNSTRDQVIEESIEQRKICSAVFLDASQAFDIMCHTGLIRKLPL